MKQSELIKELFSADFIAELEINGQDELYDLTVNTIENSGMFTPEQIVFYEADLNRAIDEITRNCFRAGVDCTLALLGHEPAFNEGGKDETH